MHPHERRAIIKTHVNTQRPHNAIYEKHLAEIKVHSRYTRYYECYVFM